MPDMVTMWLGLHVCPAWMSRHMPACLGLMNAHAITGAFKAGWVATVNSIIVNVISCYHCTCARLQSSRPP